MSEVDQLRAEVREIRETLDAALMALVGAKKAQAYIDAGLGWRFHRRFDTGTPLYKVEGLPNWSRFCEGDIDLLTLEEVSARPRAEIQRLRGVGSVTMQKLEAAMADKGLTWGEAG